jgi:TonB family protein
MNRSVSFSISFVGHTACVGLLLLTCSPAREKPIAKETCRVTLLAPASLVPPGRPVETRAPTPAAPRKASETPVRKSPKPTFNPRIVTRKITRETPAPSVEYSNEFTALRKLDKETTPSRPVSHAANSGASDVSISTGSSASYDAIIAGYIKSKWVRPSRGVVGDNPGPVSVAVRIAMNGEITRSQVVDSSGIDVLDVSAIQAIQKSNPLPVGLPGYMTRRYYDVTIVFCITDEA